MKYSYKKKTLIILFTMIDLIGGAVSAVIRLFKRPKEGPFNRILIIRLDHIGDVINATAVLEPMRKAFPDAVIDFLAPSWEKDIIGNSGQINELLCFDPPWFDRNVHGWNKQFSGVSRLTGLIKKGQYDLCIDLRGDLRHITAMAAAGVRCRVSYGITGGGFLLTHNVPYEGVMSEIERNMGLLKAVGVKERSTGVKLSFPDNDSVLADELMAEKEVGDKFAVVHMVPGHRTKEWQDQDFADVIRYLSSRRQLQTVAAGAASDTQVVKRIADMSQVNLIDLTGKTSLGVLYNILRRASLFVGVDSAPAHMAAAAGVPAVILFSGANDPDQWAPAGDNVKLLYPGKGKGLSEIKAEDVRIVIDKILEGAIR